MKKFVIFAICALVAITSCDRNKGIEAQIDPPNPIDIIWEKLEKPDVKYKYDWGDTCIVSMDYNDGKWIGLTQWKNVKLSASNVEFQPI
ncbi:MAG: hypothetical protein JXQ65_16650 [Candidatus Marinimicrobia bacterium]|nr:hypothetical protein [Candidatus Neomarinimicrobiota bacterium]